LINKMKDGLIHAMKVKQPLSFNRSLLINKCGATTKHE